MIPFTKTAILNYVGRALLILLVFTSCKKDVTQPASGLPIIITTSFSSSDEISAAGGGGSISSDGGFSISSRGLCWSTNHNPTINDGVVTAGSGSGNFSADIIGLMPGTSYYVRAFATNSNGTSYGNEISLATSSVVVPQGLIGYYKFNNNTLDYSGKNNPTTSTNIVFVSDHKSVANSAAKLDGLSSLLTTNMNFNSSTAMSFSLWVQSPDYHNGAIGDSHNLFGITTSAPNYTIAFQSCSPTAGTACDAIATVTTSNTSWNHYVVTFDGATCKTYLNGTLSVTKTINNSLTYSETTITMGKWSLYDYWSGNLDNVKIYNRVVSAAEVTQLYQE